MQGHKLLQVVIVQGIGLAQPSARVQLVIPDLARGRPFLKKQHHGLDARAKKGAAGAVQDGVQIATLQEFLA